MYAKHCKLNNSVSFFFYKGKCRVQIWLIEWKTALKCRPNENENYLTQNRTRNCSVIK